MKSDLVFRWPDMTPAERLACKERPDPLIVEIVYELQFLPRHRQYQILIFAYWLVFRGQVEVLCSKLLRLLSGS